MNIKRIFSISLMFMVGSLSFAFAASDHLNRLVKEGLENNQKYKAAEFAWKARGYVESLSDGIPQPHFVYTYFGESVQTKVGPQNKKIGVRQKIPFLSKLKTKRKIANTNSKIAYNKYVLAGRGLVQNIKNAYYDYYFATRALEFFKERKIILESLHASSQSNYETGLSSQQSLIRLNIMISKINEKLIRLKEQQYVSLRRLNKLLARDVNAEFSLKDDFKIEIEDKKFNLDEIKEKALLNSPILLLDSLGVDKSKDQLSLSRQGFLPDFAFMADYIDIGGGTTMLSGDGKDAWMVGVDISVPLWFWNIYSDVKAKKSTYKAKEKLFEDRGFAVLSEIEQLIFKLETSAELYDLYVNVMVYEIEDSFSIAQSEFETSTATLNDLVKADQEIIEIKLAGLREKIVYKKLLARLEYIIGEEK